MTSFLEQVWRNTHRATYNDPPGWSPAYEAACFRWASEWPWDWDAVRARLLVLVGGAS